MIVPNFWAEARLQHRDAQRRVTVRRFGWSDESEEEAQQTADARAADAMERILAGEELERRERRVPYNGSDGVPIREEVIERHGETVITRNSYGALCLNTPDVLFADIDFDGGVSTRLGCSLILIGVVLGGWLVGVQVNFFLGIPAMIFGGFLGAGLAALWNRWMLKLKGGIEKVAIDRIGQWMETHPNWRLRVYRTPNGFRLLAMHRVFEAEDAEGVEFMLFVGSDDLYMLMCANQRCFRARVSPKPWRIGMGKRLRPRPGTWPVRAEVLPMRREWVAAYEKQCEGFASARFESELGSGAIHESARAVQRLHDELARVESGLPIA